MTIIALTFVLILLVQLIFIILVKKPEKLLHNKAAHKSLIGPLKISLICMMALLYITLFMQLGQYHKPQPLQNVPYVHSEIYPTSSPSEVQELGRRYTSEILNLYFLYTAPDKSQKTLGKISLSLRQKYCAKLCIINMYDDKTAYEKDIQRVSIVDENKMKEWNKQNYVFVADHYLGYLDAVQDAVFAYYPFHDGYYTKAKSGSLDGY